MNLRVASNPGDYRKVRDLIRREGIDFDHALKMPTIMAFDSEDKLIGAMGTTIQQGMIIAGPLVMDTSQRRIFSALRLIEAYENAMRNIGIVAYILSVEDGSLVSDIIERYYPHVSPYAVKDGVRFYARHLDGSQEIENGRA